MTIVAEKCHVIERDKTENVKSKRNESDNCDSDDSTSFNVIIFVHKRSNIFFLLIIYLKR